MYWIFFYSWSIDNPFPLPSEIFPFSQQTMFLPVKTRSLNSILLLNPPSNKLVDSGDFLVTMKSIGSGAALHLPWEHHKVPVPKEPH